MNDPEGWNEFSSRCCCIYLPARFKPHKDGFAFSGRVRPKDPGSRVTVWLVPTEELKAKITKPMKLTEILEALGMKAKQEGTLRQVMTNYPGLLKSDGKRPATYTLDTSR